MVKVKESQEASNDKLADNASADFSLNDKPDHHCCGVEFKNFVYIVAFYAFYLLILGIMILISYILVRSVKVRPSNYHSFVYMVNPRESDIDFNDHISFVSKFCKKINLDQLQPTDINFRVIKAKSEKNIIVKIFRGSDEVISEENSSEITMSGVIVGTYEVKLNDNDNKTIDTFKFEVLNDPKSDKICIS